MNILFLESATEYCSVAIANAEGILSEAKATEPHQQSSHLTILIEDALKAAKLEIGALTHVALGHGPGSYTGLRVGAAVAKGLCLALPKLKFITADSMHALALLAAKSVNDAGAETLFFPTVNSRKGEVYTQPYGANGAALGNIRSEILSASPFPEAVDKQAYIVGTGVSKVAMSLGERDSLCYRPDLLLSAADLYPIAWQKIKKGVAEDYTSYEPLYIKPPFVTKSTKKLL